jgi:hypothetical protein
MNTDRDDGDLRHVFVATASEANRCHLCLKHKKHPDHVPYTVEEDFRRELAQIVDESRQ